jgi:protein phosphatase
VSQEPIIHWAGATVSGTRKPRNDDSWIVFCSNLDGAKVLGEAGESSVTNQDMVFAVSDGMGGGNAGDLASSLILEQMALMIPQTFKAAATGFFPDSIAHLEEALKEVHKHINQAASHTEDENMYLANVGDSRIYLFRDGKAEQLTRDHTAAWLSWKRGEISEIEYRQHPRRAALYEVVGGGGVSLCPHLAAISYSKGDRFLICSDGLIDGIWERHISDAMSKSETPQQIAEALLKRSIENSGVDDTTLVVIHVE